MTKNIGSFLIRPLCRRHRTALALLIVAGFALSGLVVRSATNATFAPEFVVVQINDVYRIDAVENEKLGGLGRVASIVRQTQKEQGNVFIFHAGDFLSPSLESDHFQGRQMVDAMNFLGGLVGGGMYVVPGNHEFDRGSSLVAGAIERSTKFTWLSSNIDFSPQGDTRLRRLPVRSKVVTMGGMKVGIFALTIYGEYGPPERRWPVVKADYAGVAEEEITNLEKLGADIIVGLTHLDVDDDKKLSALRARHPSFMWIAGGHEHTSQEYPLDETHALITKSDSNARSIWLVQFGREGGKPAVRQKRIDVNESIPVDPEYVKTVEDPYHNELRKVIPNLDDVVGTTTTCLDGREETVRNEESNLGNYVVDQMRTPFPGVVINAAVLNSGTLRIDDRVCEKIKVEHLKRTIGFQSPIAWITITGEHLRNILEHAITAKRGEGRFLQVSGIRFEFDRNKGDGQRVSNVWINKENEWTPLVRDKTEYRVAVSEYMLCGGDSYDFTGSKVMKTAGECKGGRLTERDKLPDIREVIEKAVSRAHRAGKPVPAFYDMRIVDRTRVQ